MKKSFLTLVIILMATKITWSQTGIGTTTPDASAILDISSSNKGILFPRMTSLERNTIANPATGLTIFNTTTNALEINKGTSTAPNWTASTGAQGETGLISAGNAAGNTPFWNGTNWINNSSNLFNNGDKIGIGTTTPNNKLHVKAEGALGNPFSIEGFDHVYQEFYPFGLAAGRKAYFGFSSPNTANLTITNEATDGNIELIPNGTGKVTISGLMYGASETNALFADASGNLTYRTLNPIAFDGFWESDPVFNQSVAKNITALDYARWSTAFSWGNHAGLYRPISYVPDWNDITSKPTTLAGYNITNAMSTAHAANAITTNDISAWSTAFGWGNHAGLYLPIAYVPSWSEITSKPTFATVATTGSYDDLTNKPITDGSETKITAGANVTVTGSGTISSPYVINTIANYTQEQRDAIVNPAKGLALFNTSSNALEINKGTPAAPDWTASTGSPGASGLLTAGNTAGNTPFWDGTSWITDNSNLFNNGGNIGIGTSNPNNKLHIKAAGALGNPFALEGTDHVYQEFYPLGMTAGRKAYVGFGSPNTANLTIANEATNGNIELIPNGTGKVSISGLTSGTAELNALFTDASGNLVYRTLGSNAFTSGGSGGSGSNTLIGSNTANYLPKWNGTDLSSSQVFDDGTNVGIGTNSPQNKFHIKGNGGILALEGTNNAFEEYYPLGFAAGRKAKTGFLSANSADYEILNLATNGNIVLTPTGTGNIRLNGIDINNSTNTALMLDSSGNVVARTLGSAAYTSGSGSGSGSGLVIGDNVSEGDFVKYSPSNALVRAALHENPTTGALSSSKPLEIGANTNRVLTLNCYTTYGEIFMGFAGIAALTLNQAGADLSLRDAVGGGYGSFKAAGFTVVSDRRQKNNIHSILPNEYDFYLNQIRSIESATFKYNFEKERKENHIGVIAQTLPKELQSVIYDERQTKDKEIMGMSLADMAGLSLIGIKAIDHKISDLELKNQQLEDEINALNNEKIVLLKRLLDLEEKVNQIQKIKQ